MGPENLLVTSADKPKIGFRVVQSDPMISIVTVVWNNIDGLRRTVDSIRRQNYRMIQHVVIDGGSSDGTVDWLETYHPDYAVTYISEPDEGIYDAMNKGMARSTGEIVQFLNGGDELADSSVLKFVGQSYLRESWNWAYGGIRYVDGDYAPIRDFFFTPFSLRRLSLGLRFTPHPATYVRKSSLAELGGFNPRFGFSADQELALRLGQQSAPTTMPIIVSNYLIEGAHGQSKPSDTAKRYARIRRANGMTIAGLAGVDRVYTSALAGYWTLRAHVGRARRSLRA